jgi:hypothetical protein
VVDTDLPTPQQVDRRLTVVSAPELVASEQERFVGLDSVGRDEVDGAAGR